MEEKCFHQNMYVCDTKKSKFIKKQEARGLWSSFGIKKPLRKTLL